MLLTVKIEGVSPLLLHNGAMVDPFNDICRELKKYTGKRKKTDEDLQAIAKLEWLAGLYLDEKGHPCIPGECLEACLKEAARKNKQGKDAIASITCDGFFPLLYDGPKDAEKLWESRRFYKSCGANIMGKKVWRTRPMFVRWALDFTINYREDITDRETVEHWLQTAGSITGLCDWRPKFGRFRVVSVE